MEPRVDGVEVAVLVQVRTRGRKEVRPAVEERAQRRLVGDQIRPWLSQQYIVLGTDGFGRSESREALRDHFEVDRKFVVLAALRQLVDHGGMDAKVLTKAIKDLGINVDKVNPRTA